MSPRRETFAEELTDVHDAGKQILAQMAKAAQPEEAREAFEDHREETPGRGRAPADMVLALGGVVRRAWLVALREADPHDSEPVTSGGSCVVNRRSGQVGSRRYEIVEKRWSPKLKWPMLEA